MTDPRPEGGSRSALVGYDGSPPAASATEIGARLLPDLAARVVHLWSPPFANAELRRRLVRRAASLDELGVLLEREGEAEAERIAAEGVALARACAWEARPLTHRSYGGEGFELARLAEELEPEVVVLGARGLSGVRAMLGSVSDMVVHYSPVPALVVPHPLLSDEREAAATGPVVIGCDGSEAAQTAMSAAALLFKGRELIGVKIGDESVLSDAEAAAGATAHERVVLDFGDRVGTGERQIAGRLADFAAERGAALVVVGSRGRSAAREIMLGSVAMATLHHAHRPVLVVPGGDRFPAVEGPPRRS